MPKSPRQAKTKPADGLTQSERFVKAAQEAGADGDSSVAELLMGRMAKSKPSKPDRANAKPVKTDASS